MRSAGAVVVLLGVLAAAVWSVIDLRINLATMVDSVDNATAFLARVVPLDFPPLGELVAMTAQTLAIVVVATALAVVLSTPAAIFAAANTTTGPLARGAARSLIVLSRAIPDVIFAIVLFRFLGLGALPGILALAFHSVGMIGKLYADAIEQVDAGPPEAITAAGGRRWQWITGAVLPQVMPQVVATALHRFDINLRTAVLLGYVGVGGIGMEIANALRTMNYQRGMALALVVLVVCVLLELLSGAIRARLAPGAGDRGGWLGRLTDAWVHAPRETHRPQRRRDGRVRVTPPWDAERIRRLAGVLVTVAVLAAATVGSGIDVAALGENLAGLPAAVGLFWPPETGGILPTLLEALLITVQIGLAATLLGMVLALPIGVLAARNVAPHPRVATALRTVIVTVRAFPELIIAIVLIVITGLGPVPGALALGIGSVGLLGKLVADSVEETDVRVQDALRAAGATRSQVFFGATLRQALPAFVAHVLYQLDVNIRSATLLGIVGAGGIGFYLLNAARVQEFGVVTTIVLLVLAVVLSVEAIAVWARRVVR
ncbi:phosphonate ABC transporter, permease protein PhnE [Georgenia alba]|uniref:Phosphonate ABC transporter, permease protein PhnE n=1 Tax=Georgenia alba TaxID=2233858 RepID=A0ABW2Q1X8_9MICO